VAQLVRDQLEQVGVRAVLKMTDRTLFLTRIFLQEYDLALVHFNIPLDPDQHYFWAEEEDEPGYGLNVSGYTNATVDEALAAGNSAVNCAMTEREDDYDPVWRQLNADLPMLFLFAPNQILNLNPAIEGVSPSSFAGTFWNLAAWKSNK
jgi:ABC-type transport system substrate-binding protein